MRMKKSVFERIVREEVLKRLQELIEAGDEEGEGDDTPPKGGKKPPKPPELSAGAPPKPGKGKGKGPGEEPPAPGKKPSGPPPGAPPAPPPEEVPDEEDPADDELDAVTGDDDGDQGDDERGGGKVSDEIVGKRIQSISMEPKSKMLPGAQEITITFDEVPDPFKIFVTKTGGAKFFFRTLHNEL